jgi:hypothetical protein
MDRLASPIGAFLICGIGIALAFGAGRLIAFFVAAD